MQQQQPPRPTVLNQMGGATPPKPPSSIPTDPTELSNYVPPANTPGTGGRSMKNIRLQKFDMNRIKDDSVIVFIGKRNTGKSFLIKDLLWHKRNFPVGTVISGTEGANAFYSTLVPSLFIHEEFNTNILNNVLGRQRLLTDQILKDKKNTGQSKIDRRAFLIMDDCMYDNKWINDKTVRGVFMNGRHWGLMYILALQYVMGIPPVLRTNIDYVFILRENMVANRRRIYDQYAGMFPNFESFCQIMDQCTENYECLVIDNGSKSNRFEDQVFWYKAASHPDFKIGSRELWIKSAELDRQKELAKERGDEEDYNLNEVAARKGPLYNVRKY